MEFLSKKRNIFLLGAVCGLVAVVLAMTGNPKNMALCVACFIRDMAGATKFHQAAVVQYFRPEIVGIVVGAFVISLATKEYKSTAGSSPMVRFLLGITIMVGALVFLGCPLRMVLRMSAGDLNAYVGLVGFAAGIGAGCVALKMGFSLGRTYETKKAAGAVLPVMLVVLMIVSVATTLFAASQEGPGSMHAPVLLSLAAGLVFGAIAQKVRLCFAGSIRDIFLLKNFDLICGIAGVFVVMTIYNVVTGNFVLSFANQPIAHAEHLWNILGMFVVGLAATLAGGCPLRQLVLAGQGSSDAAITAVGMFVGAAICHNFGLASSGEGTTPAGRTAVLVCIVILAVIAAAGIKKENKFSELD